MSVDPLGSVERAILARLQDEVVGFQPNYVAVCGSTDAYSALDAIAFDFDPDGNNFSLGIIEPHMLADTTNYEFPYLMLQTTNGAQAQDASRVKGIPFSGTVNAALRVLLSWQQEQATDFSTWPNAVSAAMVATFNQPLNNRWAPGVNYNGVISVQKSRPMLGGQNWIVVLDFQAVFYCVISG